MSSGSSLGLLLCPVTIGADGADGATGAVGAAENIELSTGFAGGKSLGSVITSIIEPLLALGIDDCMVRPAPVVEGDCGATGGIGIELGIIIGVGVGAFAGVVIGVGVGLAASDGDEGADGMSTLLGALVGLDCIVIGESTGFGGIDESGVGVEIVIESELVVSVGFGVDGEYGGVAIAGVDGVDEGEFNGLEAGLLVL